MLHWICVCHLKNWHLLWCMSLWQGRGLSRHLSSESVLTELMSKWSRVKLVWLLNLKPQSTLNHSSIRRLKKKTARPDMREKATDSNCSWTKMCSVKQRMELYVSNLIQQLETAVGECRFSPVTPEMCWKNTHSSLRPCRNSLHHQRLLESS